MGEIHVRGAKFFANRMQREIFYFVSIVCMIFILVTAMSVHYVIFNIATHYMGVPAAITYYVIPTAQKVTISLAILLPILLVVALYFASQLSLSIVGPFERILRELDECIVGTRKDPLKVRRGDKFKPLIDRINKLIEKIQ